MALIPKPSWGWVSEFAQKVHTQNVAVGWWDEYKDNPVDRHPIAMTLIATELAEAAEGARKDLMDDHLPHYKMFDVELADALIRLMDCWAAYALPGKPRYFEDFRKQLVHRMEAPEMSLKLAQLHLVFKALYTGATPTSQLGLGMCGVLAIAQRNDVNIKQICYEKHNYNRERADHKRENRQKEGGKKW